MKQVRKRTRAEYLDYLNDKLAETSEPNLRASLENAIAAADAFDKSISPLGTLARLIEACDAIVVGDAPILAQRLKRSESKLRPGRPILNSQTIDEYVRLREADDLKLGRTTEWTGPRAETIRRAQYLRKYLDARRDSQVAPRRSATGTRLKRVEEIVGSLPTAEDRQDLRFVLDKGFQAQRKLDLLTRGIEQNFPTVVLDELVAPQKHPAHQKPGSPLSDARRRTVAQLQIKFTDNEQLRQFGLFVENDRLKTLSSGAHFLSRDEFEALKDLFASALR